MEVVKYFDENYHHLGDETLENIHKKGLWHETFHCWMVSKREEEWFVQLQIRSQSKQDFPNFLDVAVTGELLATERMQDGVKKIEAQLGLDLFFKELQFIGIIQDNIMSETTLNREFAHVYLYVTDQSLMDVYQIQKQDCQGMIEVPFSQLSDLLSEQKNVILGSGFIYDETGQRIEKQWPFSIDDMLPHQIAYYEQVFAGIASKLNK
ncbi:NUDIX hydrolase [Isobaculum melis]|uniref:Nudix hydrolase domain-containing protein n=1 Tax=Isobaculum melis TaxID=142588 RepID=A0A1H9QL16_9LACT|nr:hypothetical protein [Isobaculum melis]SER60549.1 hypothetical protein SAMN04488559_102117 [Isobaculum melis]